MTLIRNWSKKKLVAQVLSVQERTSLNLPRKEDYGTLPNIDYHAVIVPYDGCVGGDHLGIISFKDYLFDENKKIDDMIVDAKKSGRYDIASKLEKNLDAIGILISDALGNDISASIPNTYLHGAFQMGLDYELMINGEVTSDFFRRMNRKFYNYLQVEYLSVKPFVSMLYGEIHNDGVFRFLSAGHPLPLLYSSKRNKMINLDDTLFNISTPLGITPKDYHVITNKIDQGLSDPANEVGLLRKGDILILHTDGLLEKKGNDKNFSEDKLEQIIREEKKGTAKQIYTRIREELESYSKLTDDLTLVVIKKN